VTHRLRVVGWWVALAVLACASGCLDEQARPVAADAARVPVGAGSAAVGSAVPASAPAASIAAVDAASAPAAPSTVPAASAAAHGPAPVFVLNSLDATVSMIDPASGAEVQRIAVGKEPHHLYLAPDERSLLVANAAGDSISVIDARNGELKRTLTDILDPYHLRFSPDMQWFVTAANRLDHVDIYRVVRSKDSFDLQLAKRISAGDTPSHLAIDSKSSVVYATMQDSDELMAIDLATQMPRWTIAVGKMPADVYLTPDDKTVLIGLTGDRAVEVYDVSGREPALVKRIETGDGAHAFRAWGDGRHVLVSNRVANTVSRIDLQTLAVTDTYPAPGGPDCIDLSRDRKTIYVTSRWARKLTLIDTEKKEVIRQVDVGRSPHGVWTLDHASR
jgi:YVTN family beta-propeller protein